MTLEEAVEYLRGVRLVGRYHRASLGACRDGRFVRFTLISPVRDAYGTGDDPLLVRPIYHVLDVSLDELTRYEPADLLELVRRILSREARHEIDEAIMVGESRPFDPHRDDPSRE